jgi:hypothetical protein
VPRSDAEGVHWYRLAAAQDSPEAISNLGMMFVQGRGVKRDVIQAFELIRKAAERSHAVAQNNLGLMYANGQGVARDYVWAYAWLDIAPNQLPGCGQLRDRIGKEMTRDDIEKAKMRAAMKRGEISQRLEEVER